MRHRGRPTMGTWLWFVIRLLSVRQHFYGGTTAVASGMWLLFVIRHLKVRQRLGSVFMAALLR
jgi:hypothetical protein